MKKSFLYISLLAVFLAFFVVMLGAYTRLTDAGLGCPDWPGCYGHINVNVTKHLAKTDTHIEYTKALTEMVHRYFAGTLGLIILFFGVFSIRSRIKNQNFPLITPLFLMALVIFQALLGMWTVTLKLLPVVVMSHLLGGFTLICSLWWLFLSLGQQHTLLPLLKQRKLVFFGLIICIGQVILGGWVSANYAGISCLGFPYCNGELIPSLNFYHAFNIFSPLGPNYQGGSLDSTARMTIQFAHRIGAIVTAGYVLFLCGYLHQYKLRLLKQITGITMFVVCLQFTLGVINVVYALPLPNAVLHNGVAALLLLCMVTLNYYAFNQGESS